MTDLNFFPPFAHPDLATIADWAGAELVVGAPPYRKITAVAPLETARRDQLSFFDNPSYRDAFRSTRAGAVIVQRRFVADAPAGCALLVSAQPYRSMAAVLARLYPSATRPAAIYASDGASSAAHIHPKARLEPHVTIEPGAVIGAGAEIGARTIVGPHAVIGPGVRIGRDCSIGAHVSVLCALLGDRVVVHPGARIGQDGFGFAMGPSGHIKVPQVGRVIIQDDVDIGAGTTIDRGANRDTIVGEGTKIDNLVQIGHNVVIGRHCVLVSQVGVSGSCTIGDFVALGGRAGIAGHIKIGAGAQIAAASGVMNDVPAGAKWCGSPAKPIREFFREVAALRRLAGGAE